MRKTIFASLMILGSWAAQAATVSFTFSTPSNSNFGSYMHSFESTPSGYSITAYGFEDGKTSDLYMKNDGPGETGLGLAGQDGFEIGSDGLLIINIASLSAATALDLKVDGDIFGQSFAIYGLTSSQYNGGSKEPSLPAKALFTGDSSLDGEYFAVPNYSNYQYLALTANCGNVLLEGLSATFPNIASPTPEPATMGIVGLALVGVALAGRRVRKAGS